jgi:hypothetical protein
VYLQALALLLGVLVACPATAWGAKAGVVQSAVVCASLTRTEFHATCMHASQHVPFLILLSAAVISSLALFKCSDLPIFSGLPCFM